MALPRLFRIFYSTIYTILNIVLLALLIVTPSDAIRQALANHQLYNVFVIAGCYFITVAIALLIYASRIYTARSAMAAIPKTWIPVQKGDVANKVRKMVVDSLNRSAVIAWDTRPRKAEADTVIDPGRTDLSQRWKEITHDGWSSPYAGMANLQYTTVILELPHLIEARIVSLNGVPRPSSMGLRDYLACIGVTGPFLDLYEIARFGGRPLDQAEFGELMHSFAQILESLTTSASSWTYAEAKAVDSSSFHTPGPAGSVASASIKSSVSSQQGTVRTAKVEKKSSLDSFAQTRSLYAGSDSSGGSVIIT